MINKSRVITSIDWGNNSPDYSGYRSQWWGGIPYPGDVEEHMLDLYNNEPRTFTLDGLTSDPYNEVFYSTIRKRPLYNDCSHTKKRVSMFLFGSAIMKSTADRPTVEFRHSERMSYDTGYYDFKPLSTPTALELTNARSRAWWEMQPRFEGEFQALNFLFELKDFTDLLRFLTKDGGRSWHGFSQNCKKIYRALERPYAKKAITDSGILKRTANEVGSIADGIASLNLLKNLAIDPFVRDLANYVAQVRSTVSSLQQEFADNGLNDQKRHYSELLHDDTTIHWQASSWATYPWQVHWTRSSTKFTASMQYSYDYQMRSVMDAFVKYWGLEMSAEAFWNSIPFSFVVDYFMQIGKAVHAMEIDKNVDLRVIQYCESVLKKSESSTGVDNHDSRPHLIVIDDNVVEINDKMERAPLTELVSTEYDRIRCWPTKGLYVPILRNASNKQLGNLASLVKLILF